MKTERREKIRAWIEKNISLYHVEDIDDIQILVERWEKGGKNVLLNETENCKDCTYETMLTDNGNLSVLVAQCENHRKFGFNEDEALKLLKQNQKQLFKIKEATGFVVLNSIISANQEAIRLLTEEDKKLHQSLQKETDGNYRNSPLTD